MSRLHRSSRRRPSRPRLETLEDRTLLDGGWGQLWGSDDDQPRFARSIKFAGYPGGTKSPLDAGPPDFRILSADPIDPEPGVRGADLDRLPQPAAVNGAAP